MIDRTANYATINRPAGGTALLTPLTGTLAIDDTDDAAIAGAVENGPLTGAALAASYGRPGVFNANAAPYNCTPGVPGTDQAAGLEAVITAAITWAIANTGAVVVELDDGEYYLTRAVQTTGDCRAQVPITPRVTITDPCVSLTIRSKQGTRPISKPFFSSPNGGVVFRSTLTGQTYSGVTGWPSMFGGRDKVHGTGDLPNQTSILALTFQGVVFRQPANPSLCAVNASLIDSRIFEDCGWDTLGIGADGRVASAPTAPTGICDLPPVNNLDGNEWRGVNMAEGYYGGPSVGELMSNHGTIYSLENFVAYNLQAPWYHLAMLGFFFDVRCAYGLAQIDPTSGVVAVPTGLAYIGRTHIKGTYDVENKTSGWNTRVNHINDPDNKLGGQLDHIQVISAEGNTTAALTKSGGIYINYTDLTEPAPAVDYVLQHTFTGADSTSTAGAADTGQAESQLSGVWGRTSNRAYRVSGTGVPLVVWDAGIADGTFETTVTSPTDSTEALLIYRGVDANNFLYVDVFRGAGAGNDTVSLGKKVSGSFSGIGSPVTVTELGAGPHTVTVECTGTAVEVFFDSVSVFTETIADHSTATKIGLGVADTGMGDVRFDNLTALA